MWALGPLQDLVRPEYVYHSTCACKSQIQRQTRFFHFQRSCFLVRTSPNGHRGPAVEILFCRNCNPRRISDICRPGRGPGEAPLKLQSCQCAAPCPQGRCPHPQGLSVPRGVGCRCRKFKYSFSKATEPHIYVLGFSVGPGSSDLG